MNNFNLNDDDRFMLLISEEQHRETCFEMIRLGFPISKAIVSGLISFDPTLLDKIFDIDFQVKIEWNYYLDMPISDAWDIAEICRKHYGAENFLKIILERPGLYEIFLPCFEVENFKPEYIKAFIFEKLKEGQYVDLTLLLQCSPPLADLIRAGKDQVFKDCLFRALQEVENGLDVLEILNVFGLDFCLEKHFYPLVLLEEAFFDYDEEARFWDKLMSYPEAMQLILTTDEPTIIESFKKIGL